MKYKILLVEDDTNWHTVFTRYLNSTYELCIEPDPEKAMDIVSKCHLVIVNANLHANDFQSMSSKKNDGAGYAFLRIISKRYPYLPKILISGSTPDALQIQRVYQKFYSLKQVFFNKSVLHNKELLLESIEEALASKSDNIPLNSESSLESNNIYLNNESNIDFLIFSVLPEEFEEISSCFELNEQTKLENFPFITHYKELETGNNRKKYKILLAQGKMGQANAAAMVTLICSKYKPQYVLLVGICGGRKEKNVELADVIVAKEIIDGSVGEVKSGERKIRWRTHNMNNRLFQEAVNFSKQYKRMEYVQNAARKIEIPITIHHEPLFSLNDVIKEEKLLAEYAEVWTKAAGVEMEGAGAAIAIAEYIEPAPRFMMIRSVSDFAGENKEAENKEARIAACKAAAHYTYTFLKSGPI